jgi:signal transduction histidine kinase
MTYAGASDAMTQTRDSGPMGLVRKLSSPRVWQATFHAVTGMLLGATTGVVIYVVGVLWWAAVYSLVEGPTGHRMLVVVYVFAAVGGPLVLPHCVRFLSALQRERFRALLGVEIAAPSLPAAHGWRRIIWPWTDASTWRQLGYHVLAPVLGGLGGLAVVLSWSAVVLSALWGYAVSDGLRVLWFAGAVALLLAAPWVALGVANADAAAARRLLGPGRAEELAERVETLARSRAELVAAADAERRRIERDLHDGAQQRLVSLAMTLGMAREAFKDMPAEVQEVIAAAHDEATAALAELREFVRGLHPAVLNDRGLDAALSGLVARAPLPVKLRVDVASRCSASIEAVAYFTVSEALTNVARHAEATRAEVTVERVGDRLFITVTDDGLGGATVDGEGSGLRGLAQRAASVDGTLTVVSPRGGPTTVTVYLPCE